MILYSLFSIKITPSLRHIMSPVTWSALPYFPKFLLNGTIFGYKLFNIKCVFLLRLQLLSPNVSHTRKNSSRYFKFTYFFYLKYCIFLTDFKETCFLLDIFPKNPQISNFKHLGVDLFHADTGTARHDKASSRFSLF